MYTEKTYVRTTEETNEAYVPTVCVRIKKHYAQNYHKINKQKKYVLSIIGKN